MKRLAVTLTLAACAPAPDALPLFGGYRTAHDPCQRVGENAQTNQFLDDSADLVGCPEYYAGVTDFAVMTGAIRVGQMAGYVLFSVPRR